MPGGQHRNTDHPNGDMRRPSRLISSDEQPVKPLFARLLSRIYKQPVCNRGADGETIHTHSAVPSAQLLGGRTDLRHNLISLGFGQEAPPHVCAWGGALHRPRFPDAREDDGRGEVVRSG